MHYLVFCQNGIIIVHYYLKINHHEITTPFQHFENRLCKPRNSGGAIIFLFFANTSYSQIHECFTVFDDEEEQQGLPEYQQNQSCYSLDLCNTGKIKFSDNMANAPLVTLRVNFHFVRTGNYGLSFGKTDGNCPSCANNNTMNAHYVAERIVQKCNERLANLQDPILKRNYVTNQTYNPPIPWLDLANYPVPNVIDSRFRLELYNPDGQGAVHVHEVPEYNYATVIKNSSCYANPNQVDFPLHVWANNFPVLRENVINIIVADEYFPAEGTNCRENRGVWNGGVNNLTAVYNMWYRWMEKNGNVSEVDAYVGTVLHEIGHGLGLYHPFASMMQCCDARETPYATDENWDISNNIMGYNGRTSFLSPCQLDIAHENSRRKRFAEVEQPDVHYCYKRPGIDEINGHIIWDEDQIVTRDVLVTSGSNLEIMGSICVGLAKDVHIHVERGALLHIHSDEGVPELKSLCTAEYMPSGDMITHPRHWGGIIVAGNPQRDHPAHYSDPFHPDEQDPGRVIIIGAQITEARHAISNQWKLEYRPDYWGAYVLADGVTFHRCHRVAEFMRYRRQNKSKFLNCTIRGYSISSGNNLGNHGMGISAWDCRGIEVSGCHFSNLGDFALKTLNGDFKALRGNTFENFKSTAIYAGQSGPSLTSDVNMVIGDGSAPSNLFSNNTVDIKMDNYNNRIQYHEINGNIFSYSRADQPENVAVDMSASLVSILKNQFDKKYLGVLSTNNARLLSVVHNNLFIDPYYGIVYRESNQASQFSCNDFVGYRWGVWVQAGASIADQGNEAISNANRWYRTRQTAELLDIVATNKSDTEVSGPDGLFLYHVLSTATQNDPLRPVCNLTENCPLGGNYGPQFYSTWNAENNRNCETSGPPEWEPEPLSLHALRLTMDSLRMADTLYRYNPHYLDLAGRKFRKIADTATVLWEAAQYLAIDSLLGIQPEAEYHWYRFGLQLDLGNFSGAAAVLSQNMAAFTDETNTDIAGVQQINLAWHTDEQYRPDSITRVWLEQIALKRGAEGGHARALLSWWYDRSWLPDIGEEDIDTAYQSRPAAPALVADAATGQAHTQTWSLYPNPGTGQYELLAEGISDAPVTISVLRAGDSRIVHQVSMYSGVSSRIPLDLQHLPGGLYLVRIQSASTQILKLIKL
jgi:hypothetical protein